MCQSTVMTEEVRQPAAGDGADADDADDAGAYVCMEGCCNYVFVRYNCAPPPFTTSLPLLSFLLLLHPFALTAIMSWLFLDWFVPLYLLVSVLVLAGFGACLYFLEPGLQDAHKWSNKTVRHHPLVASVNCRDDDSNALIWSRWGGEARRGEAGHLDSRDTAGMGANTL